VGGGRGLDPNPHHTKLVITMIPDAYMFSAQHIRLSLIKSDFYLLLKNELLRMPLKNVFLDV